MPPEFIYFDMGNVLCHFDRQLEIRQVAEVSGVAEDAVQETLIGNEGLLWRHETGELDEQQFFDQFCRRTNSRPDKQAFLRANADIFQLNFSILPVVAHLNDAQIPLGVLSNTCPSHWRTVTDGRYSSLLPGAFRKMVLSYEAGALKPDAKIYQRAIEAAGLPAERIMYIDDIAGHVEAARRVGLDAVQYTTTDALAQSLLARGIRCNY